MKNKQQFAEHLAHVAAQFVSRESNRTSLITITRADVNEKMTVCTLFYTVFPESEEANAEIFMKRIAGDMRQYMRHEAGIMRVPHIEPIIDAGDKHRRKMEELMKEANERTTTST